MAFLKFPSFKLCLALNALFVGPVHKAMLVCYVYGDPIKTNCNCILSTGTHVNITLVLLIVLPKIFTHLGILSIYDNALFRIAVHVIFYAIKAN